MSENKTRETTELNNTQKARLKILFENYLKTETCKSEFPKYLQLINDFHCALNKFCIIEENIPNDDKFKNILKYLHNDSLIEDKEKYCIAGIGQGIISNGEWNIFEKINEEEIFGYTWLVNFSKDNGSYTKLIKQKYNEIEGIKKDKHQIKKRIMMVLDPLSCVLVANDDALRKLYDLFEIENNNKFNDEQWFENSKKIKVILFKALKDEVSCKETKDEKSEQIDLTKYKEYVKKILDLNCEEKDNDSKIGNDLLSKFNEMYGLKEDCDICQLTLSLLINKFIWYASQYSDFIDDKHKNLILHGPPGNGKTYLVKKFLEFKYSAENERKKYTKVIQFHPSYTYEDFIDGLKPTGMTESGQLKLELVNGHFKDFCIKASKDLCNDYYFIVDEINRANLSSVFGELLNCLEYRAKPIGDNNKDISLEKPRKNNKPTHDKCNNVTNWSNLIELQNSKLSNVLNKDKVDNEFAIETLEKGQSIIETLEKGQSIIETKFKFGIPENVYFIGMMNDVDKSIESFDLALRRRFKWKKMECNYDVISEVLSKENTSEYVDLCKKFNSYISQTDNNGLGLGKQYELGHSYFLKIEVYTKKRKVISDSHLNSLFDNHIDPILTEYLRLNYEENEIESKINEAKEKFQFPK